MEPQKLRLVPGKDVKVASLASTAGSLGLHDTMQFGPRSLAAEIHTENPLRSRLENWDQTQDDLQLNVLRNLYGLHAPVREILDRKPFISTMRQPGIPRTSNIGLDILMGRDETLDVSDIFTGEDNFGPQQRAISQYEGSRR